MFVYNFYVIQCSVYTNLKCLNELVAWKLSLNSWISFGIIFIYHLDKVECHCHTVIDNHRILSLFANIAKFDLFYLFIVVLVFVLLNCFVLFYCCILFVLLVVCFSVCFIVVIVFALFFSVFCLFWFSFCFVLLLYVMFFYFFGLL